MVAQSLNQAKDREGQTDVNERERGRNEDDVDSERDAAYAIEIFYPVKVSQADRQEEAGDIAPEKVIGMALE